MQYKILDVSKYQPNINYAECAKDIDGVILRCGITGYGWLTMAADPCFEKHYAGFKAAGVPVGAYYYTAADSVAIAEKEADFCIKLLKDKQFELPIYYDVECPQRQNKLSKAQLTQIVQVFCTKLEKAGYFTGVYANTSWFTTKLDHAQLSSKYTIWLADYRANPNTSLLRDMHQYTSGGTVAGISGRVDLSNCTKDFTAQIKNAGLNGFIQSQKADKTKPLADTAIVMCCKATGFDKLTITDKLKSLNIGYIVDENEITTAVPVSAGDQIELITLTEPLKITWQAANTDTAEKEIFKKVTMLLEELEKANNENKALESENKKMKETIDRVKSLVNEEV